MTLPHRNPRHRRLAHPRGPTAPSAPSAPSSLTHRRRGRCDADNVARWRSRYHHKALGPQRGLVSNPRPTCTRRGTTEKPHDAGAGRWEGCGEFADVAPGAPGVSNSGRRPSHPSCVRMTVKTAAPHVTRPAGKLRDTQGSSFGGLGTVLRTCPASHPGPGARVQS